MTTQTGRLNDLLDALLMDVLGIQSPDQSPKDALQVVDALTSIVMRGDNDEPLLPFGTGHEIAGIGQVGNSTAIGAIIVSQDALGRPAHGELIGRFGAQYASAAGAAFRLAICAGYAIAFRDTHHVRLANAVEQLLNVLEAEAAQNWDDYPSKPTWDEALAELKAVAAVLQ